MSSAEPRPDVTHQPHGAGEGLAHPHALLLVDEERVGFDGQVTLQDRLGMNQHLQRVLGVSQPLLKALDRLLDFMDLIDEAGKQQESPVNGPTITEVVSSTVLLTGILGTGFPPSACSDKLRSLFLADASPGAAHATERRDEQLWLPVPVWFCGFVSSPSWLSLRRDPPRTHRCTHSKTGQPGEAESECETSR